MKKINIWSPEKLWKKFNDWFDKDKKIIFMVTFIFGFILNIMVMTNDILFTDAIVFTDVHISDQWELSLGRWLLHYVDYFRFGLASPVISTLLSLVYISFSSVLLIDLFKIKKQFSKYLISLLLAVSPFFYELLLSVFCSSEFILSFLLSILAVYFIYKDNKNIWTFILSALCVAASLGLYQSFIGVTCGLCVLVPLQRLLIDDEKSVDVLKKIFKSLAVGILGVLIYWVLLQINLNYWHVEMASYSGANEIGLKTILEIPMLLGEALKSFISYYFNDGIINNLFYRRNIVNILFFATIFVLIFINVLKSKQKKKILYYIEILTCIILVPFCFGIIELIIAQRDINQLMCAPYILVFPFAICLIENLKNNYTQIFNWILNCLIIFTIVSYATMSNASYMSLRIKTNKVLLATERIIDLIESNENYVDGMKVIFMGNADSEYFRYTNKVFELDSGKAVESPLMWANAEICNRGWHNLIHHYFGIDYNIATYEEYLKIASSKEFEKMNIYPDKNSVKVIDDIMVVKILENPSLER